MSTTIQPTGPDWPGWEVVMRVSSHKTRQMRGSEGEDPALRNRATRRLRTQHIFQMRMDGMVFSEIARHTELSVWTVKRLWTKEAERRAKLVRRRRWP